MNHRRPFRHNLSSHTSRRSVGRREAWAAGMSLMAVVLATVAAAADPQESRTWPQAYTVTRDDAARTLILRTPYYTVEQDLAKGGAVSRIALVHGKARNLLVQPVATRICNWSGVVFSDLNDSAPAVAHRRDGLNEIVTVQSALKAEDGRPSGVRLKTVLEYRWGHVKIRKEFHRSARHASAGSLPAVRPSWPPAFRLRVSGRDYRGGKGPGVFVREQPLGKAASGPSLGSAAADALRAAFHDLRRSRRRGAGVVCRAPILWQWDLQLTGRRGAGPMPADAERRLRRVSRFRSRRFGAPRRRCRCRSTCVFDFYLAFPILDGHAQSALAAHVVQPQPRPVGVDGGDPAVGREGHPDRPLPQRRRLPTTTACSGATAPTLPIPTWTATTRC